MSPGNYIRAAKIWGNKVLRQGKSRFSKIKEGKTSTDCWVQLLTKCKRYNLRGEQNNFKRKSSLDLLHPRKFLIEVIKALSIKLSYCLIKAYSQCIIFWLHCIIFFNFKSVTNSWPESLPLLQDHLITQAWSVLSMMKSYENLITNHHNYKQQLNDITYNALCHITIIVHMLQCYQC